MNGSSAARSTEERPWPTCEEEGAITGREAPKIIVSYRRADSAAMAGRICDRLVARYGSASVFMDVDRIPFGVDFRDHIRDNLLESDVLVAVVGPEWRGAAEAGARIDEADDPVRVEVETAFAAGVPVIPVLVSDATMPSPRELPESLERFAFLHAAEIDTGRDFRQHADRLIGRIDSILEASGKAVRGPDESGGSSALATAGDALRQPHVWALLGILALPFAASRDALAPPWPPGVGVITGLAALLGFALARRRPAAGSGRAGVVAGVAFATIGLAYLLSLSLFTYQTPTTGERWAKGLVCTEDAVAVFGQKCPALGLDELRMAEYEADRLWTAGSLAVVRAGLLLLWLAAFAALATVAASFEETRATGSAGRRRTRPATRE